MIQVTPQMRILLAVDPVDFRSGIDGLGRICKEVLQADPLSGTLFAFRNRRGTSLKLLVYDGQGAWMMVKRLSRDKVRWWPRTGHQGVLRLDAHELQILLWNGDPSQSRIAPAWRRVASEQPPPQLQQTGAL